MKTTIFKQVLFLMFITLALSIVPAMAGQVTLQWDANDPAPEGYRLFSRTEGNSYQYDNPDWEGTETTHTLNLPLYSTDYYFVVRAFVGDDESGDSNEVWYRTGPNPIPNTPSNVTGSYDKSEKMVTMTWEDTDDSVATHWIIYYKMPGDTSGTAFDTVNAGDPLTVTSPFTAVAPGDRKTVEFYVIAHNGEEYVSSVSDSVMIDIDRRLDKPVQNLRIQVQIPVE